MLALGVLLGAALALGAHGARFGLEGTGHLPAVMGSLWVSKFTIFGGAISDFPYGPWVLALVAWMLDLLACVGLLSGVPLLARLPFSGPALASMRQRAFLTLVRYPGLERMALFGVGLFVFLPIPGSGSVIGTLVGQLVGLSRTSTLLVVALGSGLAAATMAAMATLLSERWESLLESPLFAAAGFVLLLLFAWIALVRAHRQLRRA
jgi:uncharacterized membrane protein